MTPQLPVFDPDEVLARMMGKASLVEKVLQMFLGTTPEVLDQLGEALASGDAAAARELAHSLKGSAANIAARQFAATAACLEDAARDGDVAGARSHWQGLLDAWVRLNDRLAERGGPAAAR